MIHSIPLILLISPNRACPPRAGSNRSFAPL